MGLAALTGDLEGLTGLATSFWAGFGIDADADVGAALEADFETGLAADRVEADFTTGLADALVEVFAAGLAAAIVFLMPVDKVMIALLSHVLCHL